MNYIREIKSFNLWLDCNQVPKNAIGLWYALMAINNFTSWKKEFTVSMYTLAVRTGFSPRELYRARVTLQELGRITYTERSGRDCAVYTMRSFEEEDTESNCGLFDDNSNTVNDTSDLNSECLHIEEKNDSVNSDCHSTCHISSHTNSHTTSHTKCQSNDNINKQYKTKQNKNKTSLRNDDKSSFVIKSFDDGSQPIKIPEKKNLIFEISPTQNPEITQITTKQDEDLARGPADAGLSEDDGITEFSCDISESEYDSLKIKRNTGRLPAKSEKELCKRFIEEYNRKCTRMPQVTVLTDFRKKHIMNRYKDFGEDGFINMLVKASSSDFLNGQSESGWKANFDWLIRPTNFIKVIEGNYNNEKQTSFSRHKGSRSRPSHFSLIKEAYEDVLEMNDIKIDFNPIGI